AVAVRTAIRRVDFQCGIDQEFRYVVRGGAPVDLLACNAGQVGNAGVGVVAGFLRDHRSTAQMFSGFGSMRSMLNAVWMSVAQPVRSGTSMGMRSAISARIRDGGTRGVCGVGLVAHAASSRGRHHAAAVSTRERSAGIGRVMGAGY